MCYCLFLVLVLKHMLCLVCKLMGRKNNFFFNSLVLATCFFGKQAKSVEQNEIAILMCQMQHLVFEYFKLLKFMV